MNEPAPTFGDLPLPLLEHVDQLCERYEAVWRLGTPPLLADYVHQIPQAGRAALLRELLRLDLEYRGQRGERPALQEYLDQLPTESDLLRQAWPTGTTDPAWLHASWAEPQRNDATNPLATPRDPGRDTRATDLPRIGGYEILKELAHGGMGVVYLARQTALNRTVALKILLSGGHASAEELARFRTEAEAVAQCKHPHLVEVYDYGTFALGSGKSCPFMALEYVEGGTLREHLVQGPLDQRSAAQLVAQLAHAIQYAHERGIIHRDLKPANILLAYSDQPSAISQPVDMAAKLKAESCLLTATAKITDFGLAKRLGEDREQTKTGQILGTPSYMAPEQATGNTKGVTTLADVYGLGAILYELLVGSPPFLGDTSLDILLQVQTQPPTPPHVLKPQVDRDLEVICLKCLAKEPAERYASARELALDLERWLAGEPIHARPPAALTLVRLWLKQNFGSAGWTVLLGMVYGLVAAVQLFFAGPHGILVARAAVYREDFPSLPAPWWAMDYVHPQWLRGLGFVVVLLGTASAGLIALWVVRPRNRFAEIAAGLVIGTASGFTLFILAGGWFAVMTQTCLFGPAEDLTLLVKAARASDTGPSAGVPDDPIARRYPDLLQKSPGESTTAVYKKFYADFNSYVPWAILYGLICSLFVCETVCLIGVLAASRAVRCHGWNRRMLLSYYAITAPAVLLVGLVYNRLLFWNDPTRPILSGILIDLPVWSVLILVIVAQMRAGPRWFRLLLHLLWMAAVAVRLVFFND